MVNSEVSGVAFSRHPLTPLSSDSVLVEAVYGLGEGLVSGELEADRYQVLYVIIISVFKINVLVSSDMKYNIMCDTHVFKLVYSFVYI